MHRSPRGRSSGPGRTRRRHPGRGAGVDGPLCQGWLASVGRIGNQRGPVFPGALVIPFGTVIAGFAVSALETLP